MSEDSYRRLVEAAPMPIVVHSDGCIVFANPAAVRLAGGQTAEDLIGRRVMDFVHPDFKEIVAERTRLTQESDTEAPSLPEKLLRLDGQSIDVQVAAAPITFDARSATQVVIQDLSEHVRAERALEQSEYRYRQMIETAGDVVFTTDYRGYFTYMNPRSQQMIGYQEHELIGTHFIRLIDPDWKERVLSFYQHQYQERIPEATLELPIITRDGQLKWVEQTTALLMDGDLVSGFQSIVRDITERHEAEASEKEQRRFAEALAETAAVLNRTLNLDEVLDHILVSLGEIVPHDVADIMLVESESDEIRIVRSRGYERFGVSEEMVKALRLPISDTPNLNQMAETRRPLVISDVKQYRAWVETPTAQWIRSYLGAPICVAGVVIGFLNLDSDRPDYFSSTHAERLKAFADQAAVAIQNARLFEMTRKYAEELEVRVAERTAELRIANEELHALSRIKDEFVANVSHELRTPITSIKLYHGLLTHYPERLATYLETLQRETARLERIVEDLLYLSRLDQEAADYEMLPIDLNAVASELVMDRSSLAKTRDLSLTFHPEPDLPLVSADKGQMGKVLSILLTNALNYTPSGGAVAVVSGKRQEGERTWATLKVSDTGPGIAEEERSELFRRFYRGKAGRNSGAPGTGLGLAIAREIVERHRGRIEVGGRDDGGSGATFTLWLPAAGGSANE